MADFPPVASLRSFEAVARLGSVTQAAHEMSVTHSAVSQHIKQLEALVGVTLFIRHGRGVRITEEGRLYALQIREALQHIADATRMVQIKPRTMEVTLATLPSFGCHWLLPRLARFQARHPQIAVRLLTSLAVVNLQQEGIDLAIRMGQGDWEGWKAGICLPMNSWWWPRRTIAAATCRPPRRRSPPAISFFPWSPGTPGAARRGWKRRSSPRACA
jgi:LysR family glycine cleavage system transcriptional activator